MEGVADIFGNIDSDAPWRKMLSEYTQIPLWDSEVPGFKEEYGQRKPSITFFPADTNEKTGCVVVMAGGSYTNKSPHEGKDVALRLNKMGLNAAVLDYRVIPYARDVILLDAKRAVRFLRYNAEKYGILANKIGVMGFSAGGNLAALTCFCGDDGNPCDEDPVERVSSRPDGAVLAYAAVNFVDEYDDDDDDEFNIIAYFDFVLEKGMQFPPAFIWQSMEDSLINFKTSLVLAEKLGDMRVPVELHLFPEGDHGQGLAMITDDPESEKRYNPLTAQWSDLCEKWFKHYGFM